MCSQIELAGNSVRGELGDGGLVMRQEPVVRVQRREGPWHIRSEVRSSAHRFPIEQALLEGRPPIKMPIFWVKFRSRSDPGAYRLEVLDVHVRSETL